MTAFPRPHRPAAWADDADPGAGAAWLLADLSWGRVGTAPEAELRGSLWRFAPDLGPACAPEPRRTWCAAGRGARATAGRRQRTTLRRSTAGARGGRG